MGSFWATGGQVEGMMAELIGTKLGLVVTSDDLDKAVRERGLSELWPDDDDALYAYLADVQTNKLEMPPSDAYQEIVARSIALVKPSA